MSDPASIPYLIDFTRIISEPDIIFEPPMIGFILGLLFAVTINAEAQAFMAANLGDHQPDSKDRFHFNPVFHLDILGTLTFFIAGFGWPRKVAINVSRFRSPRLYSVIVRFAGALANIIVSSILSSLTIILYIIDVDPIIVLGVISVNITVGVYNLLPLPPLAASTIISALLADKYEGVRKIFERGGPFVLVAILLVDRFYHLKLFSPYFDPMIVAIYNFLKG